MKDFWKEKKYILTLLIYVKFIKLCCNLKLNKEIYYVIYNIEHRIWIYIYIYILYMRSLTLIIISTELWLSISLSINIDFNDLYYIDDSIQRIVTISIKVIKILIFSYSIISYSILLKILLNDFLWINDISLIFNVLKISLKYQ